MAVLEKPGVLVEKLTENIVDQKNIVQKLVEANQSLERKYQELVSTVHNQTNIVNKVFTLCNVDWSVLDVEASVQDSNDLAIDVSIYNPNSNEVGTLC